MKKLGILFFLCSLTLLAGCASLLEREYSLVEPHSSKFWESEAAATLRAENHQDIVNDLLLLIGQHTESATIRLYNFDDDMAVAETLEQATTEIQQETPMGRLRRGVYHLLQPIPAGYYEIDVQISYRRTAEQIQAVVNATSVEALSSLLEAALNSEKPELAVRIGFWRQEDRARVEAIVEQLRQDRGLMETPAWAISYYPAEGTVGLIEFLLQTEEPAEADVEKSPENFETNA